MHYQTQSPHETRALGKRLADRLRPGMVVALDGPLGAGKTAFVQGIAEGLGVTDAVVSPTFAILCIYRGDTQLVHMDAYRVLGVEDLESTGYFDYLDGGSIIAVEWSRHVEEMLPGDTIRVIIEPGEGNLRTIVIEGDIGALS